MKSLFAVCVFCLVLQGIACIVDAGTIKSNTWRGIEYMLEDTRRMVFCASIFKINKIKLSLATEYKIAGNAVLLRFFDGTTGIYAFQGDFRTCTIVDGKLGSDREGTQAREIVTDRSKLAKIEEALLSVTTAEEVSSLFSEVWPSEIKNPAPEQVALCDRVAARFFQLVSSNSSIDSDIARFGRRGNRYWQYNYDLAEHLRIAFLDAYIGDGNSLILEGDEPGNGDRELAANELVQIWRNRASAQIIGGLNPKTQQMMRAIQPDIFAKSSK